jgi:transposase, IS30 family
MGQKYKQMGIEERCEIARLSRAGETIRQIAASLDRSPSSISRELKRNDAARGYMPMYAQEKARARCWTGSKLLRDPVLQADVLERMEAGASPQAVAGRLQRESGQKVISHETIYRFIYAQIARTKDYRWRHYLPQAKSKRGWRGSKGGSPVDHIRGRVPIAMRPAQVESRKQPGHWEADLMLFSRYGQAVLALHERVSRVTAIVRQPSKEAAPLAETLTTVLAPLPARLRRTLTFDNGTEFAHHYMLHKPLNMKTFFCDPHAPWQKGGIENAIGRLRRDLPRKTNLDDLGPDDLLQIARRYNHVPRKCLDYQTPAEVFSKLLHFKCESTFPLSRE